MKIQKTIALSTAALALSASLLTVPAFAVEGTLAAELFRHGEIDIQSLDMANVQISVGFGRESGLNLPDHLAFRDILLDEFLNKIRGGFFVCFHEYSLL